MGANRGVGGAYPVNKGLGINRATRARARSWGLCALVAISVALTAVLLYRSIRPALTGRTAYAQQLLDAIYEHKAKHGLWPQYLSDLAADHPDLVADAGDTPSDEHHSGWDYTWDDLGWGFQMCYPTPPRCKFVGIVGAHREGTFRLACFDCPVREPVLRTRPSAEVARSALAELARRQHREPACLLHYQGQVYYLLELGRTEDARVACQRARARLPGEAWPLVALTYLARGTPDEESAASDLSEWLRSASGCHPSYWEYVRDRARGDHRNATASLGQTASQPIPSGWDDLARDCRGAGGFFIDAALYAYQHARPAVATRALAAGAPCMFGDTDSVQALRAACLLAEGDTVAASEVAAYARANARGRPARWQRKLDELAGAIAKGDTKFRFDPGPELVEYVLFAEYQ